MIRYFAGKLCLTLTALGLICGLSGCACKSCSGPQLRLPQPPPLRFSGATRSPGTDRVSVAQTPSQSPRPLPRQQQGLQPGQRLAFSDGSSLGQPVLRQPSSASFEPLSPLVGSRPRTRVTSATENAPSSLAQSRETNRSPNPFAETAGWQASQTASPASRVLSPTEARANSANVTQVSLAKPASLVQKLEPGEDLVEFVRRAPGVVLIDFYADWCQPCQQQSQILERVEQASPHDQASIIKVNIDQHPELVSSFGVSSLPTLMLIKNGQVVERKTGVADQSQIFSYLSR